MTRRLLHRSPPWRSAAAWALAACAAWAAAAPRDAGAQPPSDAPAHENVRDAFVDRGGSAPWYDPQADRLRPPPLPGSSAPFEEPGTPDARATETPPVDWSWWDFRWLRFNPPNFSGWQSPWAGWSFFGMNLGSFVVWLLIGLLLAGLTALLVWALWKWRFKNRGAAPRPAAAARPATGTADRIEQLPFALERPQTDLLGAARAAYEAGRCGEAVIYYFSYQLVQLDQHGRIRLAQGKTNRQYLRELGPQPVLAELLEQTMEAFEDVFFGGRELERRRFESCWLRLDEFRRRLPQGAV